MKNRITIRDVAKKSGLSIATVSGALNGAKGYSKETIRKVWEVANQMNYSPRTAARNLQAGGDENEHGTTSLIMYIVSRGQENPVLGGEMGASLCSLSCKAQCRNLFVIPYSYYQLDGFRCPPLLNGYVEGAIVGTPHLEVVHAVHSRVPTVLVDVPFSPDLSNVPMVNGDWRYGSAILLKRLSELGHRSIAFLQPYDQSQDMSSENILTAARKLGSDMDLQISERYSFHAAGGNCTGVQNNGASGFSGKAGFPMACQRSGFFRRDAESPS